MMFPLSPVIMFAANAGNLVMMPAGARQLGPGNLKYLKYSKLSTLAPIDVLAGLSYSM